MEDKINKRSFDCPDSLYWEVINYGTNNKIKLFKDIVVDLLRKGLLYTKENK